MLYFAKAAKMQLSKRQKNLSLNKVTIIVHFKKKFMKKIVKHVDGKTDVVATGKIVNDEFIGSYKFEKMSWGITIPVKFLK